MEDCSYLNNSTTNKQFSGNVLSQVGVLCSFVLSHPLYLSYFLFFSPYLIKLLAYLSPLFFTTTLLISSFSSQVETLQLGFDRIGDESIELEGFEEFEVYIAVFGSSTFGEVNPVEISLSEQNPEDEKEKKVLGVLISEERESPVESPGEIERKFCGIPITDLLERSEIEDELEEEKILGVLISDERCFPATNNEGISEHLVQEMPKCEKLIIGAVKEGEKSPQMADKKCLLSSFKPLELTPSSINGGNQAQQRGLTKSHSTKHGDSVWDTNDEKNRARKKHDDEEDTFSYSTSPHSISPSLSNLGSMRKEKEWRRTLACKLFEERHNGGGNGGEEMDSLWEAYEKTEENRGKQRSGLKKMKSGLSFDGEEDEEDDDDEEEGDNGKLCCLQALKFSAVKMNFGMGKPGFMKITKAFKGIGGGWLSHHSRHQSGGGRKKGKK